MTLNEHIEYMAGAYADLYKATAACAATAARTDDRAIAVVAEDGAEKRVANAKRAARRELGLRVARTAISAAQRDAKEA